MSKALLGLRITAGICALGLALFSAAAGAQTKPSRTEVGGEPPQSLMWVGNSFFYYNNSMHNHYGQIAREVDASKRYRSVSVTISGSGIDWHDLDTYLRPGLIGKYSFAAGNEVVFNKPGRQFDAVMMMDCSQCPVHPAAEGRIHRIRQEEQRDHQELRRQAGVLHVLGVQGQARNDGHARRGLHGRGQRERRAGRSGRPRVRQGDRQAPGARALREATSGIRASRAPTSRRAPPMRRCGRSPPSTSSTPRASIPSSPPSCGRWPGKR